MSNEEINDKIKNIRIGMYKCIKIINDKGGRPNKKRYQKLHGKIGTFTSTIQKGKECTFTFNEARGVETINLQEFKIIPKRINKNLDGDIEKKYICIVDNKDYLYEFEKINI